MFCWDGTPRLGSVSGGSTPQSGIRAVHGPVGTRTSGLQAYASVGAGSYELRIRDDQGAFRVIYVAKFENAIFVLHAFQKKTRKTQRADIELAAQRYRMIGARP